MKTECKLEIYPMSVNMAWQGRRYKTKAYKNFERSCLFLLPKLVMPEPPYEIHYDFGFSNTLADIDNPVKPFQDILQTKYGINDRHVLRVVINKTIVERGKEYVYFSIEHYEN